MINKESSYPAEHRLPRFETAVGPSSSPSKAAGREEGAKAHIFIVGTRIGGGAALSIVVPLDRGEIRLAPPWRPQKTGDRRTAPQNDREGARAGWDPK